MEKRHPHHLPILSALLLEVAGAPTTNRLGTGSHAATLASSVTLEDLIKTAALIPQVPDHYVLIAKDWDTLEKVFAARGWPVKKIDPGSRTDRIMLAGGVDVVFSEKAGDAVYCVRKDMLRPPTALPMTTLPPSPKFRGFDPAAPGADHTVTRELPPSDLPDEPR